VNDTQEHQTIGEHRENKGEEVVTRNIYIDPEIDLNTEKMVEIIIHFKTEPAKVAVAIAETSGIPLSLDKAKQDVEDSHARFQADVQKYLGLKQIPYTITHTYKTALNGVAMKLPGNEIKTLLQSGEIAAIYLNKEIQLNPPPQPE
jgi:CHAT domain-containing protein